MFMLFTLYTCDGSGPSSPETQSPAPASSDEECRLVRTALKKTFITWWDKSKYYFDVH